MFDLLKRLNIIQDGITLGDEDVVVAGIPLAAGVAGISGFTERATIRALTVQSD